MDYFALIVLGVVIVTQHYTIQKLTNKLMSRNYYEYEQGMALNKERARRVRIDNQPDEDLGPLNEIGV